MEESGYEALKKAYHLPSYDEMNREYEIGVIEDDDQLARNISKKITEKLEFYINTILTILQPETDFGNLHEVGAFEEKDKDELLEIYRKLMYAYREANVLVVEDSDKANATFIKKTHEELNSMKPDLKKFFKKLQESWKTFDVSKIDKAGYFG